MLLWVYSVELSTKHGNIGKLVLYSLDWSIYYQNNSILLKCRKGLKAFIVRCFDIRNVQNACLFKA